MTPYQLVRCQACGADYRAASYIEARGRTCPDCKAAAQRLAQGLLVALAVVVVAALALTAVVLLAG